MKLVLIGQSGTKRTDFFRKAATQSGIIVDLKEWNSLDENVNLDEFSNTIVKIDPPSYETISLLSMQTQLITYQNILQKLQMADCRFLNTPKAICQMLDKRSTKNILQSNNVPVTRMFDEEITDSAHLLELMKQKRCYAVFVKPRFFSGAAGVAALRLHPIRNEMILFSSCHLIDKELINTKKILKLTDRHEIVKLLDALLALDCVIERWHSKAEHQGKSYDLRVVWQFGQAAHIVVRQAKSPITNLHLNNQAMDIRDLHLKESVFYDINDLCQKAVSLFPGLSMAGIDVMLDRNTLKPRIIEMNGQGDLVYQDIFTENKIYLEQIKNLLIKP